MEEEEEEEEEEVSSGFCLPRRSTVVRPLVKRPVGPAGKSTPLCGKFALERLGM